MNFIFSMVRYRFLAGTVLISMLLFSCSTSQKAAIDTKDLSYLYNPTKSSIKPRFSVFNQTERSSLLSVKFFPADLFFSEANPQGVPMAQILVTVKLFNITSGRLLSDTAFVDANIVREPTNQEYVYKLPLIVEPGMDYMAEVKILDKLRAEVVQSFVPFNTRSDENKYNFVARGSFLKNEIFDPVIRPGEQVNLIYPVRPVDSLYISIYQPLSVVPYPPSMLLPEKVIDYPPDSVVALPYSDTISLKFLNDGVYFCSLGRESEEGFTFFNFGTTYPAMTDPLTMIKPLAYLASEDEMSAMLSSEKPKVVLDDFWIKCGGNVDKARELIRIFYTRVVYSNFYFTSFKEGWRTERGMIYIIYGPPDKVYKNPEGESWGYRRPELRTSWGGRIHLKENYIFFNFRTRKSKFSDNDFFLSRSETLVTYWDRAVASWRKGMVFRLDNPEDL